MTTTKRRIGQIAVLLLNQILASDNINISGSEEEKYNLNLNLLPRDYGFIKNLKIRIK
jgi:hypothetical protein